jgi:hypothetical protein
MLLPCRKQLAALQRRQGLQHQARERSRATAKVRMPGPGGGEAGGIAHAGGIKGRAFTLQCVGFYATR